MAENQTGLSALVEFAPAPGAGRCVHAETLKRTLQIGQITGIPVGGLVSVCQLGEIVSDKTGQRGIPFGCKTANFSNDFVLKGESYVHPHMLRDPLITFQAAPWLLVCLFSSGKSAGENTYSTIQNQQLAGLWSRPLACALLFSILLGRLSGVPPNLRRWVEVPHRINRTHA
jgi:hypothetical protein